MLLPPAGDPAAAPAPAAETERQVRILWRYLRMHGASAVEADDLTQEAFALALQKRALAAEPAAAQSFLLRTARHLFLRLRRADARAPAIALAVDQLWQRDCAHDGGDDLVAAARACVEQLDGRARQVIEMSYGLGQSESSRAAIAQATGLQENGVKTLMQRTRKVLRECIERRMQR